MTDCLFCKIVAGDIPAKRVYEDELVLGFRDINPQAPTHVLLIPKRHIATLNDLQVTDAELIGRLYLAAKQVAEDEGIAEAGYRTLFNCNRAGGQEVYHLHLHLLGGRQMTWPPG
ncbi:MAG: histidine triad nucleotide-binding protein [Gammaproteobacteria bacterium]|nr:histidine triad nucleotide-binding protein [Gammaproteobacteria bacterium]